MYEVEIYTDGACQGNPGPGGWGALLRAKGAEKELWGGEAQTTNNRMELTAAIRALDALKRPSQVRLHTDSLYLMKGITEWIGAWKRRGWLSAAHFKHIELRWIPLTLELDHASKLDRSPSFIRMLMQRGETAATSFLAHLP